MSSCTERMTKEFVKSEQDISKLKKAGTWYFEIPRLIAFKDVPLNQIPNDSLTAYWMSFQAFQLKKNSSDFSLQIDSVGLTFLESSETVWKKTSRIAPHEKSGKSYLSFEYFDEVGIYIPDSISQVKIFFDAVITDPRNNEVKTSQIMFQMDRSNAFGLLPFMIQ